MADVRERVYVLEVLDLREGSDRMVGPFHTATEARRWFKQADLPGRIHELVPPSVPREGDQ